MNEYGDHFARLFRYITTIHIVILACLSVATVKRRAVVAADTFTSIYILPLLILCSSIYSLHSCRRMAVVVAVARLLLFARSSCVLRVFFFFILFHRNHKIMGKNRSI